MIGYPWKTSLQIALPVFVLFVVSGCASSSRITPSEPIENPVPRDVIIHEPIQDKVTEDESADLSVLLREEVGRWNGTPYQYGGDGRRGIDCSAFVMQIFDQALGIRLPRTTHDQLQVGSAVQRSELKSGDLVFFRPDSKARHVGIYLDDQEFAHASTNQGVTISSLNDPYWRQKYWTARRILLYGEVAHRPETDPAPVISAPSRGREKDLRVGW